MKSPLPSPLAALVAASLVCTSFGFAQTVVYRETFGNNTGGNLALANANIGWNALYTTTVGGNLVDGSAAVSPIGVTNAGGVPTNLDNVNAGASLSTSTGYVFNSFVIAGLDYTSEYTIDRGAYQLNSVSWYANRITGASGAPTQNFAVQIGGSWYVTTPPVASNVGGTGNSLNVTNTFVSINLQTVTWNSLTAAAGAPISVGASTVLPDGNVTAFGIYYNNGANPITTRFETVEITATAIPEPSTYAALVGSAALGLVFLRRRSRA